MLETKQNYLIVHVLTNIEIYNSIKSSSPYDSDVNI